MEAKGKKNHIRDFGNLDYIFYIDNDEVLSWAMYNRLRGYILNPNDGTKGDREVILKGDCRVFVEAVNNLAYMVDLNLGLFQKDIDQLYNDFLERVTEDQEYHSYGFTD